MNTQTTTLLILGLACTLGCGEAYATTVIDGSAQVKLEDAIQVLLFVCATIITAAGTIVALAFWAGSRFQKINDEIQALRAEMKNQRMKVEG